MDTENKNNSSFWKLFFIVLTTALVTAVLVLAGLGLYIFKANPFNVQACLISSVLKSAGSSPSEDPAGTPSENNSLEEDRHPLLNESQEKQLEDAGIDVESLPTTISPETESCLVEAVGKERAEEIKAGDTPTTFEIFKSRSCF
jgi:hypothetical protein